jgi:2-polyprenyl-6-methoxyphenol hydroxylase-like FAD-dependent oxidoreductase
MNEDQILIVGAGPTGLTLALFLAKAGVRPRIIDKNSGPGQASRAMAVQARTLEFYRQIGLGDEVVNRGIQIEALYMRANGRVVAEVAMGDIGRGLSPYPFVLTYPQDDHEKLLAEKLREAGVEVEWNTEIQALSETPEGVRAGVRTNHGALHDITCAYICGCDGAHSAVRRALRLEFPGGTYDKTFFVADVRATGEAASCSRISFCVGGHDFMLVLPVRSTGMNRLIGIIPAELGGEDDIGFEEIRPFAESVGGIQVETVNWFSIYRVHHRVASHFRMGRSFICGDAGHIHSPAGGQGMNTGIGDAVNLAWKLAATIQGRADQSILDTYEPERIAFARSLVATTDKMFQAMTGSGILNEIFRDTIFPHLLPLVLGFEATRQAAFRMMSQSRINYRDSSLSDGVAGVMHGGDRLPWLSLCDEDDNFAPLQSLDWQIHVYGEARQELRDAARTANMPLHEFAWNVRAEHAGFEPNALYLVRPDGYVAIADPEQDSAKLTAYLARFRIVGREGAAGSPP